MNAPAPLNPQADDPAISLLAVFGRVRAGESAGWAGVELGSDGQTVRLHVHGSACHDARYTLKALAELMQKAAQAAEQAT